MPTAFPQVTFPVLNDGQDMTAALATTLEAFVLDGNHRLLAAKQMFTAAAAAAAAAVFKEKSELT